jgi:hypothetical protein
LQRSRSPGVTVTFTQTATGFMPSVVTGTNAAYRTFGRITTMTGNRRIMQFGIKFGF